MTIGPVDHTTRLDGAEFELVDAVQRSRIAGDLHWLAEHGLRLGGDASERDAALELQRRLTAAGIDCQLHEFDAFVSHAPDPPAFGPAGVRVLGAHPEEISGKVYAFSASTRDRPVEGDLLPLRIGAPAEYRDVDARGRIVLTDLSFGLPHSEPVRVAQANGASGVLVANWSDRDGRRIHTSTAKWTWGNPTADDLADLPSIPVVAISRADGQRLRERARSGALTVALDAHASRGWTRVIQPVATIPGASERFVLLHCHLDSFGAGVTDNATGVAGLMELARVLNGVRDHLGLTVRIAWWACHEMPYDGSTAYLDEHWDEFREDCVATLNADSWALRPSHGQFVALAMAELQDLVHGALDDLYPGERPRRDFDYKEGEQSFWSPGISSAFLMSVTPDFPDGPITGTWFHTEHDTREHVDETALRQLIGAYALIVWRLTAARPLPLRVSASAERLASLLEDAATSAPSHLRIGALAQRAAEAGRKAAAIETAAHLPPDAIDDALLEMCRALNPVLYTIAGPYGQDPVAASFLRERPPGLMRALRGLADADAADRPAWVTTARRERNRIADAILRAQSILDGLTEPKR